MRAVRHFRLYPKIIGGVNNENRIKTSPTGADTIDCMKQFALIKLPTPKSQNREAIKKQFANRRKTQNSFEISHDSLGNYINR